MNEYDIMRHDIAKHCNCTFEEAQDIMLKIVRTPFWQVEGAESLKRWAERLYRELKIRRI